MTPLEKRTGLALASIFSLRMLGLFLILPVFSIYAKTLPGGDNLTLVGIALGAYGLTQAIFQIPFGMASDRYGRKKVIVIGLVLFAVGSVVAAQASDIYITILGRIIQGSGAISAAVTALAADMTREQHRTKVMAMIGSSIGLVFALSLVAAPALYKMIGMEGMFLMTGILAVAAIYVVLKIVPPAPPPYQGPRIPFKDVLNNVQLLRLNFGIFVLHMGQMAMFVVMPSQLISAGNIPVGQHWWVYLPAVLVSFVLMVPAIIVGERKEKMKEVFVGAIGLLLLTELIFCFGVGQIVWMVVGLVSFFVAFNILEASLPSLVSRTAPAAAKGAALGVYNTTQALGLFTGGAVGGWLAKNYGVAAVFTMVAIAVAIWLALAASMQKPTPRGKTVVATK